MTIPEVSAEYKFGVGWKAYQRISHRWVSVHKTLAEADAAAEKYEKKYPKKDFVVFEYFPKIETAYPVRR